MADRYVTREKIDKALGYAEGVLGLLKPSLPGPADDIAIGGAVTLIKALRILLKRGRNVDEIVEKLKEMDAAGVPRLDVDETVDQWLERQR